MRRFIPVVTAMLGLVACAGGDTEEPTVDLEQLTFDQAAVRARERADAIADLLEQPLAEPYFSPSPCGDPAGADSETGVYSMHSSYTLLVGQDRLADALRAARAHFAGQGHAVEDIRWSEGGGGRLRSESPDGYRYLLTATTPPRALAFWVDSPCYQAPADEVDYLQWVPPPQVGQP